jgi:uncharacterized membrane protein YoaT (DUF817 family)
MKEEKNSIKPPALYLWTVLFAVLCLLLVSQFWQVPSILFVLLAINALMLIIMGKPRHDATLFILAGIWGAGAEMVGIYFGAWSYPMPNIFGIPFWLPLVWGTAGVFLMRLSDAIKEYL